MNCTLLATLHDIGKIAIPKHILEKPGRLSPSEWDVIKRHPEIGYRIAMSIEAILLPSPRASWRTTNDGTAAVIHRR